MARVERVLSPLGEKGGPRRRGTASKVQFWTPFLKGLEGVWARLGRKNAEKRREKRRREKRK